MNPTSSFDDAAPTPIPSRDNSTNLEDTYANEQLPMDHTQLRENVHSLSQDDHILDPPIQPIGGIFTKYKKSGLLFKARKSYTAQNAEMELQHVEMKDENFAKNLNENDYAVQPPVIALNIDETNKRNLSPKFSPKSDRRRSSNMSAHEFNFKSRRRSSRPSVEEVKNNSKIRAISESSVTDEQYMNSISSPSALSDFARNSNQHLKNKHSIMSTDTIDENKETEPVEFVIDLPVKPIGILNMPADNSPHGKFIKEMDDKFVSKWEYFVIFISSSTTWIFYNLYTAFYNWNAEIKEYNNGSPTDRWHNKYLLLMIVYCVFIWVNMAFNPYYFSYFRKLSGSLSSLVRIKNADYDVNSKKGMIRVCLIRFWIICAVIYCIVMTGLCIVRYDDYSVRLARLTVLYVLMPPLISNIIISGHLLKLRAGIFIAFHSISWIISTFIVFLLFKGYDGHSLHLTYFFIVAIGAFCAYLITAVCIKAFILIKEADLRRQLSISPKNISLDPYIARNSNSASSLNQLHIPHDVKDKFKGKPIDCCCHKFQLSLKKFFLLQSLVSASTFWGFWGVVSISPQPKYDTITELLFVLACCWWNPMFYSTTNRARNKAKSIKKYILNSYFIFGALIGLIQCGIFALYWYIKVEYGKDIGVDGENGLHLVIFNDLVLNEANVRYTSFFSAFIVSFLFYFPATGYLLYRSPLAFALSHLFFATMAVFIPLAITDIADRNVLSIDETEFGIKFITDEFDRDISNKKVTVIILYMVVFAMFLSLSGFSCTYFRFKKVLVESQAIVTGYKYFEYRLEYPMTITMFITLVMSFGDFLTDFLFAFVELGLKDWIRFTARTLFIVQILLQLFSLQSVILKVRGQLSEKHSKHQLRYFREWLYNLLPSGCGKCGIIIIYPFCWIFYYIFVIIISLFLSATKTISVRQVQQWWLSLIVVNYKKTANKKLEQHSKTQKEIKQKLENLGQYNANQNQSQNDKNKITRLESEHAKVDDYFYAQYANINDHRLGLNDIHAMYWSELNKIYENNSSSDNILDDDDDTEQQEEEEKPHHSSINSSSIHLDDNNQILIEDEYDANYDPRFDDDNISMRIQKINRKKQNTKLNKERQENIDKQEIIKKKSKKKKKKKKKKKIIKSDQFDTVWLGWNTAENDLGIIFKIYLFVDKYTPKWMRHLYINANVYNTYFLTELIVESLPQCILIITNAYLKNDWTPISIASIFFSGGMIVYNVAKIVYYVGYMNKDMRSVVL